MWQPRSGRSLGGRLLMAGWGVLAAVGCPGTEPAALPVAHPPELLPDSPEPTVRVGVPVGDGARARPLARSTSRSDEAGPLVAGSPPARAPTSPVSRPSCPPARIVLPDLAPQADDPPVPPIENAKRLAPFFEAAARVFRGTATEPVRIAVYGDSNLTMDFQTGQMRRRLQAAYGDAGHGFVALARPWSHYQHMDVRQGTGGGYVAYAASTDPIWDRVYGLSGISAESRYGGARATVGTADPGSPVGTAVSRFDLYYAKGPRWGRFTIEVDGRARVEVDSHAPELALGVERIDVEDGAHQLACVSTDEHRPVRLLGAVLERATAGFVIDSFGVGALNSRAHAAEEQSINRAMLRERGYSLIIFATGANDVFTLDESPGHMARLIELHREALPDAPILLLTPADRGQHDTFLPTLLAIDQRIAIARDHDCALWDQFRAMGGRGSMKRFARRRLVHSDYIHFNRAGGAYIGDRLLYALMAAAEEHLRSHPNAGCERPTRRRAEPPPSDP